MKRWEWLKSKLKSRSKITAAVAPDPMSVTVAEIFRRTPEMSAAKMLECFAVDPDTPLLVAILHVLKGIEEIENENVAVIGIPDSDRTFYAGGVSKIVEAQGLIIDFVRKGNDAKRGIKTTDNQAAGGGPRSRFVRIGDKPKA